MHAPAPLNLQKPRLVNRLFYQVMMFVFRRLILGYFKLTPKNSDAVPRKGGAIIMVGIGSAQGRLRMKRDHRDFVEERSVSRRQEEHQRRRSQSEGARRSRPEYP